MLLRTMVPDCLIHFSSPALALDVSAAYDKLVYFEKNPTFCSYDILLAFVMIDCCDLASYLFVLKEGLYNIVKPVPMSLDKGAGSVPTNIDQFTVHIADSLQAGTSAQLVLLGLPRAPVRDLGLQL